MRAAATAGEATAQRGRPVTAAPKVAVICIDSADKGLLLDWARSGVMPNLGALMDRGTWCTVENPPGLFAGSLWPSFYTGVSPARHGKHCSGQLKHGTYEIERVRSYDARFATFWKVLSEAGRRVAVVDPPKAPLESPLNGVQISEWATEDHDFPAGSTPPDLLAEVTKGAERPEVRETSFTSRGEAGLADLRELLLDSLRVKLQMSEAILARESWDLFLTIFTETHFAGHLLWQLHDPAHPGHDPGQASRLGDVLREVYAGTDAALGRLLPAMGPDTLIMVYSINGIGPNYTGNFILDDLLLARDRLQLPRGRQRLARVADWADRWTPGVVYDAAYPVHRLVRRSLGLPVRDFAFRTCFQTPTNGVAGGVRINLRGREPAGMVDPADYEPLCRQLARELAELVNADTGKSIVRRVIVCRDVYDGEHLDDLPDLLVEWTQAEPVEAVSSPATGLVRKHFLQHRTGDHRPDGMLITAGPAAPRGQVAPVSIYDLGPTITSLLGVPFGQAEGENRAVQLGLAPDC
jgi:predicted AlkP superfamily phosphohydrolase/phosphomutase